jgi:predicted MFS family arabinose efflux permease
VTVPLRRNRDYLLLWSGQVVSALGSAVSSVAFPLLVLALTGSPAKAGLVGFAGTLPYFLVQLPAGGLVDRWDRKRTMIIADALRGVALGSIAVAAIAGVLTVPHIALVAFVEGSFFVLFTTAERSALPRVVATEQLPAALAQNEARTRGATLAGNPLGGALFGVAQALPFAADTVSYLLSVVTLLFIRGEFQEERRPRTTRLHREIAEGVRWLWAQPFLRAAALLVAGSNFVFQALVLALIVLAQARGASPAMVGVLLGLMGAGGLLGALVAPWAQRHLRPTAVIIGANWVWAALLPLVAVVPWPLAMGVLAGAMAFVGPAWNVVLGSISLALTPDGLRGRVSGVQGLVAWGPIPLGSLVGGVLLQWVGGVATTLMLGGAMLAVALAATLSPTVRRPPKLDAGTLPASTSDAQLPGKGGGGGRRA